MGERAISDEEEPTTAAFRSVRPGAEASGYSVVRAALLDRMFGEPRESIGRYELRERLGQGGFGVVHAAWDPQLCREVAIKLLRSDGERSLAHEDELLNEARIAGGLSHPNIVAVHDAGRYEREADGSHEGVFVVMELVSGHTLHEWLETPRPSDEVLDAFEQAGRGLAAAHAAGLVHRDFKPSNALIDVENRVRVVDFGLAGFFDEASRVIDSIEHDPSEQTLRTRRLVGTPPYMAPEQLAGERAGPASDQYALCLALREALTRGPVFRGSLERQHEAKRKGPPAWARGQVSAALRRVLDRGLAPEPADRWPSVDALLDALRSARKRRGRRWTVGFVGAMVVLGPLAVMHSMDSPCDTAAESIEQAWGPSARERVRTSLLETGAVHAEATATIVETRLDDLAGRWTVEHRAACEVSRAEPIAGAAPLACLARLRGQVAETVNVLEHADRDVLDTAAMLVAELPAPERCPMGDGAPARSEAEEDVLGRLARADVLIAAGRFDEADALITEAEADARRLDARPLLAMAHNTAGSMLAKQGEFEEAQTRLRLALELALEVDARETAAEAAATLSYVLGNELARPDEGLTVASVATALGRGLGAMHPVHATTLYSRAIVLRHAGRLEDAEAEHRRALEIRRQVFSPEHPRVLDSMATLSVALGAQRRYEEAHALMSEVLELRRRLQGPDHPDVASSEISLGAMLTNMERYEQAHPMLQHAVTSLRRTLGPRHASYTTALQNLAALEHLRGESERALSLLQQSLEIQIETLGDEHPSVALALSNLGAIHFDLGQLELARAEVGRALEIERGRLGSSDVRLVPRLTKVAEVEGRMGRRHVAEPLWTEAIALLSAARGEQHPSVQTLRRRASDSLDASSRVERDR